MTRHPLWLPSDWLVAIALTLGGGVAVLLVSALAALALMWRLGL